jgi:hypothetical protein
MADRFDGDAFNRRTALFRAQIDVLKKASLVQRAAEAAVYEKKWSDFGFAVGELNELKAKLESLEAERCALFPDDKDFYSYSSQLPRKEREDIGEWYRALKMEAAKFRFAGAAFHSYLNAMSAVTRGFLDAAFPDRRGSLYGKNGAVKSGDMRRIVLDKQF